MASSRLPVVLSGLLLLLLTSLPQTSALIGYGIEMYNPGCAFACRSVIASNLLSCSDPHAGHAGHSHGGGGPTTPECRAGDTSFLQTLAYCINETCSDFPEVLPSKLQWYWEQKTTGDPKVQPKWTYEQALEGVETKPTVKIAKGETLNFTAVVDKEKWFAEKRSMEFFEWQESTHSKYGIALLVLGFSLPIVLSALVYLPFTSTLLQKANLYITYPSVIRTYNVTPLPFLVGYAPTIGQSLYITLFMILNVIFASVSYASTQPAAENTWFESRWHEILAYVACRTGVLAFALAPLVILLSGRNNILLWLTNWSHTTYLLLHRWVAYAFAAQTVVHSITELMAYWATRGEEQSKPYWVWGIVATLAVVIMLPLSMLYVRRLSYEAFLVLHIILAVFVIVGSWYHVELLFHRKWGYEFWLYAACAVWFFDRLLRLGRIVKTGVRKSTVREITPDIVRVDIDGGLRWGLKEGLHAYATFPTVVRWRPWENHPFSVVPTAFLHPHSALKTSTQIAGSGSESGSSSPKRANSSDRDIEKTAFTSTTVSANTNASSTASLSSPSSASGVTFFIRKSRGLTSFLHTHASPTVNLTTLLEGPYATSHGSLLSVDRLVVIAGGIGITGAFPYLFSHINSKLYWSVKAENAPLVSEFDVSGYGGREKEVRVARRFDTYDLVEREVASFGGRKGKLGVVVCGPENMCDDVRDAVVRIGRKTSELAIELQVESFSW